MKLFKKISQHLRDLINHEVRKSFSSEELISRLRGHTVFETCWNNLWRENIKSQESGVTDEKYGEAELIVSLTTYGHRLEEVAITIESIMQGTIKPNRILLWLQDDYRGKSLPSSLIRQQKRGLEICYCPDWRSYKKLIPTLQRYPDACIVTIDDDVIYYPNLLEKLVRGWQEDPRYIYAARVFEIPAPVNNSCAYNDKIIAASGAVTPRNVFTGVGGVLYPPHALDPEVMNVTAFQSLAPDADDIWFHAMALKKRTWVKKVYTHHLNGEDYLLNEAIQLDGLWSVIITKNNPQFKAVFDHYDLWSLLSD